MTTKEAYDKGFRDGVMTATTDMIECLGGWGKNIVEIRNDLSDFNGYDPPKEDKGKEGKK